MLQKSRVYKTLQKLEHLHLVIDLKYEGQWGLNRH